VNIQLNIVTYPTYADKFITRQCRCTVFATLGCNIVTQPNSAARLDYVFFATAGRCAWFQ